MCTLRVFPSLLSMLLCGLGVAIANNAALAAAQPAMPNNSMTRIDRYSVVDNGPTAGQRDLLLVAAAISIPNDTDTLGDALAWILRGSGYRLANDLMLSDEVHTMLKLPLPAAHRRFESMPLKAVVAVLVGPAFHIVQDPVHRLLAFERCSSAPAYSSSGGAL